MVVEMRRWVFEEVNGGRETYYSLDILRGVAALSVLIFHYKNLFRDLLVEEFLERLGSGLLGLVIRFLMQYGSSAVQLFWAISGFVFLHVYAGRHESVSGRKFFISRFSRLYPLHFITLIFVAALQFLSMSYAGYYNIYSHNDIYHFGLNLFLASDWGFQKGLSFNGPIWSVSAEILIYFAFFLYFKIIRVNFATLAVMVVLFSLTYFLFKNSIAFCGVYFFLGSIAYVVTKAMKPKGFWFNVAISFALVFLSVFVIFLVQAMRIGVPLTMVIAPLFMGVIFCAATFDNFSKFIWVKKIHWFGDITYSSYLWHTPVMLVILLAASFGIVDLGLVYETWFWLVYLIGVCCLSFVSFKYVEKPLQIYFQRRLMW